MVPPPHYSIRPDWKTVACAFRVAVLFGLGVATPVRGAEEAEYLGPAAVAASPDGRTLFVSLADAGQVAWVDAADGSIIRRVDVPARPAGVAVSPDGGRLFVACAAPRSVVAVIDARSGRLVRSIAVGHTAEALAIAPDGRLLYVCNRFDDDVSIVDPDTGETIDRVPTRRQPIAVAVTPDGGTVVVANHLPAGRADTFYVVSEVTIFDAGTHRAVSIALPNGSTGLRGLCLSPDGRFALVTHILSNYELVPSQVVGGWTNINAVSIIDVSAGKLVNTIRLDEMYLGAANPWGIAFSADARWLCVAHAGTDELSVIDGRALLELARRGVFASPTVGGTPNDPGILGNMRRRVKLPGKGCRRIAVVGTRALVAQYFSDSLAVVELGGETPAVSSVALGPDPRWTPGRFGQVLFNDATICFQQWQSCASCHPDARNDALNWDLRNDGVGNPKNTKSMVWAHRTPPAMATGVRPTAESAVRSGIEHILFADRPEREAAAIDAYLKSLHPVAGPRGVAAGPDDSTEVGRRLFFRETVGCASCHPAPAYTDRLAHDVGSAGAYDHRTEFDTPTLVEAWRTAPYMHDGRFATVRDLLRERKHGNTHGDVESLTDKQIDELTRFVLSL